MTRCHATTTYGELPPGGEAREYRCDRTAGHLGPHRISPDEGIDWSWGGTHQGSAMSHMLSTVTMLGDDDDVR